ncbi:MAG: CRISPR-associated endonuclease Cas2 [Candidatus Taylorbacteria bacterium RIFCSPLOWO2_12_FULL_47_20]|uniref:CRISPR-associated endonuclease Cas2 n=2 Tax=Candidatus Tayloriibacteriota TaxID=1817919 RepID=A0A1G2P838_9BACT|nr:MAG: CRISPR-associated endonuclease Cas2 [Candidatus Taylorbacteria bacterium RIFCSPLOWO2_02_FULL_46_40]OHA44497.1 MAG: CRISPR-associated endonuclease Cas2 [Candidatus Taylorbacteria bacterium RIFCSPLOWO2_12_FULL_47_20]
MGKLERKSARLGPGKGTLRGRQHLKKVILSCVALTGILAVGLVAPNVIGAMAKLGIISTKRQREYVNVSCRRLIRQGLLEQKGGRVYLTSQGRQILRHLELADFKLKKPKRWDGKWRVLVFDIPERNRALRNKIRDTLASIGFIRLQDSVWVYPYDCEDLISLLKADFRVGEEMLYMIVESLEGDEPLQNSFHL